MEDRAAGFDPADESGLTCSVALGDEYTRLYSRYGEGGHGLDDSERGRVFGTAAEVLGQCPNPEGPSNSRTGLAIGKVQSGKTLSYIALTALAFDSGYRVVVVLAGRTRTLAQQNSDRIQDDLLGDRPGRKIAAFHNPDAADEPSIRRVLERGRLILITLLKNQQRIGRVRDMFSSPELRQYPVLVVDDEADQAGLNTRAQRGERSAVYNAILQMRGSFDLHGYVGYTATPQANLLISTIDELSPDFCVLVEPGEGYTGGSTFFGERRDEFVRVVPDDEADDDHIVGVPEHLRMALATFLVASAIRHHHDPDAYFSMLVHHTNRREDHRQLQSSVNTLMEGWREALLLPETDPGVRPVLQLARRAYEDLRSTAQDCPGWEDVKATLAEEATDLQVWLVNSLPEARNPSESPFNLVNNIMVGGNMLDRGVTIRGLATTYITRRVNNSQADTVEQRARWFGYKQSYLDLCRIFTSKRIRDTYTDLLSHEDDFWDSLRRNLEQGLAITDWPRMFRLRLGLRPTRSNVARTRAFRDTGWMVESIPVLEEPGALENVQRAKEFFQKQSSAQLIKYGESTREGSGEHLTARGCAPEDIIELIQSLHSTDQGDWDTSYIVEYLMRLVLGEHLSEVDALLMGDGEKRMRTVRRTGGINPLSGPGTRYPGDRNIHGERVQLQVHTVKVRQSEEDAGVGPTTALALYVPDDPRYDLGHFQVPSR